tara:strand:- start:59 stop:826 length:768 start_codon:yes stop_codon:yes gene_type:complete
MMFELPNEKVKAGRVNPKTMVIYGKPKTGKTTILSELDNCLIIDLESGSEFVDALKINVKALATKEEVEPIVILKQVINKIKEANKEKGGFVYNYIALDTVTALEDIVLGLAGKLYRKTSMGRNWTGEDVRDLPQGAGYRYTRMALQMVLNELEELCDTFIIIGHLKDKLVEKDGKEMPERGLDLTGKSSSILCSQVDAIGYIYRDDNETIINFQPSESLTAGARSIHLKGQKIVVAVSDEGTGDLTIDWTKIFI